ncbi:TIGR02117 family protein [Dongia sp.]|uniref:TIGR02117 family protein n=1 Tax=Dongia sp. TaxID=1977262 RepID=UPI0035B31FCF
MRRLLKWTSIAIIGGGLSYVLAAILLGLVPGHARAVIGPRDYSFYACDNGVHVDLVLPAAGGGRDWFSYFPPQDFAGDITTASHVALGWGARGFYASTREWGDIRPGPVLSALTWRDSSVLHVSYSGDPAGRENCREVRTDVAGSAALFAFIDASLAGRPHREDLPGYGPDDAFYSAVGHYSLFRTCNVWTAEALQASGQRMALWSPFSFQVMGLIEQE